jgi:hypothetical protein
MGRMTEVCTRIGTIFASVDGRGVQRVTGRRGSLNRCKSPECRRAVERKLGRVRKQYEEGGYENEGAALKDLREFVDNETACRAKN